MNASAPPSCRHINGHCCIAFTCAVEELVARSALESECCRWCHEVLDHLGDELQYVGLVVTNHGIVAAVDLGIVHRVIEDRPEHVDGVVIHALVREGSRGGVQICNAMVA